MIRITREEAIDKLVEDNLDDIAAGILASIESTLYDGFIGYNEYSNADLESELYDKLNENYEII
jgi:hypothetical protein